MSVGASGSHQAHAKISPSGSDRWLPCTLEPIACAVDYDRIFVSKIFKVSKLTPYLQSLGDEIYDHEVRAIKLAADYLRACKPQKGDTSPEDAAKRGEAFIAAMTEQDCWDIEHSEGSVASRTGTRAHDWSAKVLKGECELGDVPEEVAHSVKFYTDHCLKLKALGGEVIIEESVPLFYYDHSSSEGGTKTGTMDFATVTPEVLRFRDLKNGSGKLVNATDNTQLAIYGKSLVDDLEANLMYSFGPETLIDIGIVQPNHHADQPIKLWAITLADLNEFCRPIEYVATQIQEGQRRVDAWLEKNPDGDVLANIGEIAPALKFAPSESACTFCDRKNWCEARAKWLTECMDTPEQTGLDLLSMLPDLTKEDKKAEPIHRVQKAGILPDETLVAIFAKAKGIRQFLDDVEAHLEEQALRGAPLTGTKLVMGREGNRAWADEEAADAFLKNQRLKEEQRYNFKLKSPTHIEELLAEKLAASTRTANLFASHITRSAAKPALALESDKRPAISTADGFDNESGPTEDEGLV